MRRIRRAAMLALLLGVSVASVTTAKADHNGWGSGGTSAYNGGYGTYSGDPYRQYAGHANHHVGRYSPHFSPLHNGPNYRHHYGNHVPAGHYGASTWGRSW